MLKNKNILWILLVFGLFSCTEDFLETEPAGSISLDQITRYAQYNPDLAVAGLRGLYSLMIETGTGGTDLDHDDFGQKGYDIYSDILSGDMVLGGYNYGWYEDMARLTAPTIYTTTENYKPWRYYYRLIRAANSVIESSGGVDATPTDDELRWAAGQAKTIRAHSYFMLAHLFAEDFNMETEILPLYTASEQTPQPLSKASAIWKQIQDDLESAVTFLDGFERSNKVYINQAVAQSLLAYTYLTLEDYTAASAMASNVIDNSGFTILGIDELLTDGFNSVESNNWVWGYDLTLDQGLDLVSWWGQVDVFTYSYAAVGDPKVINTELYNSIDSTDIRLNWFGEHPWYGNPGCPYNKFFDPAREVFNQREVTTDYVFMRIEEMYLVKAEAEAFGGSESVAQSTLLELVEKRNTAPDYVSTLTGDDLKTEIHKQWRLEMWGEGKSYLAMMRYKYTRQANYNFESPVAYDDDKLSLDIPYQEVQDNPNISFN